MVCRVDDRAYHDRAGRPHGECAPESPTPIRRGGAPCDPVVPAPCRPSVDRIGDDWAAVSVPIYVHVPVDVCVVGVPVDVCVVDVPIDVRVVDVPVGIGVVDVPVGI